MKKSELKRLAKENPNDADFGGVIRNLLKKSKDKKDNQEIDLKETFEKMLAITTIGIFGLAAVYFIIAFTIQMMAWMFHYTELFLCGFVIIFGAILLYQKFIKHGA